MCSHLTPRCESNQNTKTETHQNRQIGCFDVVKVSWARSSQPQVDQTCRDRMHVYTNSTYTCAIYIQIKNTKPAMLAASNTGNINIDIYTKDES